MQETKEKVIFFAEKKSYPLLQKRKNKVIPSAANEKKFSSLQKRKEKVVPFAGKKGESYPLCWKARRQLSPLQERKEIVWAESLQNKTINIADNK